MPFEIANGSAGGKLLDRACGKIEFAWKHQRGTGRSYVYLFCAAVPKLLYREVPKLGSPYDGIFADNDTVTVDDFFDGNKFHLCDKVAFFLRRGGIASAISRRIFNKGASEGFAGLHRVSQSVSNPRVWNAGDHIHIDILVAFRQIAPALFSDYFRVYTFIT